VIPSKLSTLHNRRQSHAWCKLSASYPDDQKLGLKLLRFSNEAMQQLEKKRNGGTQNITVNYNYHGQGNPLMQTIIPIKEIDHAEFRELSLVEQSAELKEESRVVSQA
jgi:hypothetical protein